MGIDNNNNSQRSKAFYATNQQALANHGPFSSGFGGSLRSFTPKFDIKETDQTYELHGELLGIEQKDSVQQLSSKASNAHRSKAVRNTRSRLLRMRTPPRCLAPTQMPTPQARLARKPTRAPM